MYSSSENYNFKLQKYKIIFLGEQNVGKTCLITKFMYDCFDHSYQATIGLDFLSKTLYLTNETIRLQLWDTAGQERFRCLIPAYIRDSSVAVVVYDITNSNSFNETTKWIEDVKRERGGEVLIVLVGNKVDLQNYRQVTTDEGRRRAKDLGIALFVEASAKTGVNVNALFKQVSETLINGTSQRKCHPRDDVEDVVLKSSKNGGFSTNNEDCSC